MTTIPAAPGSGLPPTDRAMTLDFRYYFDTACDGMIVFDASRRVRQANAAFAELVGDSVEALVGRHFEAPQPGTVARAVIALVSVQLASY